MRIAQQVKPIRYSKAYAAEVLDALASGAPPMIITQNGEARAVLQDLASFEQSQEDLALLKLLALGQREISAGQVSSAASVFARIRKTIVA